MKSWLSGFLAGAFLVALVLISMAWLYRFDILDLVSNLYGQRAVGETRELRKDVLLQQDGRTVGTLKRGTRLLHRLQTESLEEFYLPIGVERREQLDGLFTGAEKSERAFVMIENSE